MLFRSESPFIVVGDRSREYALPSFPPGRPLLEAAIRPLDPARKLVIVGVGNWPTATDPVMSRRRFAFYQAMRAAVDVPSP